MAAREKSKHREIYDRIHAAILSGHYATGEQIPTELELGLRYKASRPTVSRALRELERQGFVVRRPGAGTFVRQRRPERSALLGLTVPHTEGGILAPICEEIVRRAHDRGYGVLSCAGIPSGRESATHTVEEFCANLIERKVGGVFFLPLIVPPTENDVNRRITDQLRSAGLPIVLLDRDIRDYPNRSAYDLVGVDNRRNGYLITKHLIGLGCRRIAFVSIDLQVSTSTARIAGYLDALADHDLPADRQRVYHWSDQQGIDFVRRLVAESDSEAFVCLNDDVARTLLHHLAILGVSVPGDVRVVGMDDQPFAATLPVPLTTMHQPTRAMGAAAIDTMLSRIESPDLPARDVMLACEPRVRMSCGARPAAAAG